MRTMNMMNRGGILGIFAVALFAPLTPMRTSSLTILLFALPVIAGPAHADVVAEWHVVALDIVVSAEETPARASRALAITHVAMFETMNFIEAKYESRYLVRPAGLALPSEGAAAAAAHHVLLEMYPASRAVLDSALERSLSLIPDPMKRESARVTGKALAGNVQTAFAPDRRAAGPHAPSSHAAEHLGWSLGVAGLIAGTAPGRIEAARLHALLWTAVADVYASSFQGGEPRPGEPPCISCAASAAARAIIVSELGPSASTQVVFPPRRGSGLLAVVERTHAQPPSELNEALGRRIALRTLAHYRPLASIRQR